MMDEKNSELMTRRELLTQAGALGATAMAVSMLTGAPKAQAQGAAPAVAGGKKIRIGLIGCGGRGSGATENCIEAGKAIGVEIEPYAFCDYFVDKAQKLGQKYNVPAERCFGGPDGYHKLLAVPEVQLVLLATAPLFRPLHLESAIKAGKNVFMEKPVAVDPVGVRRVIAAGKEAQGKGLCIVSGTQRRHQAGYLKNAAAIQAGAIGKIMNGTVSWLGTVPWIKPREAGDSDADYLIRNWVNWAGMSGDHIVEQHIHNVDVANWFIGHHPVAALGLGGRSRRKTGDQYDFFSVDYDYGDNLHIHSMCRQNAGCYGRVDEFFTGTEGSTYGGGKMTSAKLDSLKLPEFKTHDNPYVQEHIDLINAILENKPNSENEALHVAESTMTVIMGRMSAYTGQLIRWSDVMENTASPLYNFQMVPTAEDFEKGGVVAPKDDVIAVPGSDSAPKQRGARAGKKGQGQGRKGKKKTA